MLHVFATLAGFETSAQIPTWSQDIAPILYQHCVKCHRDNGPGPFSLLYVDEAVANAWEIKHQVEDRHMPPWPADPSYRAFAYQNILTQEEIDAIVQWVMNDTPVGNLAEAPPIPDFPPGLSELNPIHHVVSMPPYTLQSNSDEYRWFAIENPNAETIYINAIEIVPGLPEFVHHADLAYDLTGYTFSLDNSTSLPGFNSSTGNPNYDMYINAWMAGGNIVRYPDNWGIAIPPGGHFVFEIHYGPGGQGQTDQTVMNLKFVTDTDNFRPVYPSWVMNGSPTAGPVIPANQVSWYNQQSSVFSSDRTMISICPHMHYLGESYKVWMETSEGDSIPLIYIPEWHFHWQMYYTFIYPQHIPAGARIKGRASYNNTTNNPHNPNNPPQNVYWGSQTTDEMFMTYAIMAFYQPGDENILMDSTLFVHPTTGLLRTGLDMYPNPASDYIYISPQGMGWEGAAVRVVDAMGRSIFQRQLEGPIDRFVLTGIPPGVYRVEVELNGRGASGLMVKL
jgi:hypothetical protein